MRDHNRRVHVFKRMAAGDTGLESDDKRYEGKRAAQITDPAGLATAAIVRLNPVWGWCVVSTIGFI